MVNQDNNMDARNTCFSRLSCSVSMLVGGVSSSECIGLTNELKGRV